MEIMKSILDELETNTQLLLEIKQVFSEGLTKHGKQRE